MTARPARALAAAALLLAVVSGLSLAGGAPAGAGGTATVVVDFGDGSAPVVRQVSVAGDSITGIQALEGAGFQVVRQGYSALGIAVCGIWRDGVVIGCPAGPDCLTCAEPDHWAYFQDGRKSPVGAGATEVRAGDVEQWAWGTGQVAPRPPTTTTTTTAPPPTTTTTRPPASGAPGAVSPGGGGSPSSGSPSSGSAGATGGTAGGTGVAAEVPPSSTDGSPTTGAQETTGTAAPDGAGGAGADEARVVPADDEVAGPARRDPGSGPGPAGGGGGGGTDGASTLAGVGVGVAALAAITTVARRRRRLTP